jgi:hypothetical protein
MAMLLATVSSRSRSVRAAALGGITAMAFGCGFASPALAANSVQINVNTAAPEQAVPVQLSFSGFAEPIDTNGDGPTLYAVARPAGGLSCQPSFESDSSAAGSSSTDLVNGSNGTREPPGSFSTPTTFTPPAPGGYLICAWLEGPYNNSGPQTVDATASQTFSARGPQVSVLSVTLPSPALPNRAFQVNYTTQTDQNLTMYSIIKKAGGLPCASSFRLEQAGNQTETDLLNGSNGVSVFGGPMLSTATDTEKAGAYVICTWIEGPNFGEVDAAASTPITVGKPPSPPPASPALQLTKWFASRRHGISVKGTTAQSFNGVLLVAATCGKSTRRAHPRASSGFFSAHLRLPRCRHYRHVKVTVKWGGSSTFARESTSRSVKIRR